jgi:hypothetical protein
MLRDFLSRTAPPPASIEYEYNLRHVTVFKVKCAVEKIDDQQTLRQRHIENGRVAMMRNHDRKVRTRPQKLFPSVRRTVPEKNKNKTIV